jgi:hypothetical protein
MTETAAADGGPKAWTPFKSISTAIHEAAQTAMDGIMKEAGEGGP